MHYDELDYVLPPPDNPPELEPIKCELANGHRLRIETRFYPVKRSIEEFMAGVWPEPIYAIRVYCSESSAHNRLRWREYFRAGVEFDAEQIEGIWEWLSDLCESRKIYIYEDFDDFISDLAEGIAYISAARENAIRHYQELPWLTAPQWFDRIDDSIFNDQNEYLPDD